MNTAQTTHEPPCAGRELHEVETDDDDSFKDAVESPVASTNDHASTSHAPDCGVLSPSTTSTHASSSGSPRPHLAQFKPCLSTHHSSVSHSSVLRSSPEPLPPAETVPSKPERQSTTPDSSALTTTSASLSHSSSSSSTRRTRAPIIPPPRRTSLYSLSTSPVLPLHTGQSRQSCAAYPTRTASTTSRPRTRTSSFPASALHRSTTYSPASTLPPSHSTFSLHQHHRPRPAITPWPPHPSTSPCSTAFDFDPKTYPLTLDHALRELDQTRAALDSALRSRAAEHARSCALWYRLGEMRAENTTLRAWNAAWNKAWLSSQSCEDEHEDEHEHHEEAVSSGESSGSTGTTGSTSSTGSRAHKTPAHKLVWGQGPCPVGPGPSHTDGDTLGPLPGAVPVSLAPQQPASQLPSTSQAGVGIAHIPQQLSTPPPSPFDE